MNHKTLQKAVDTLQEKHDIFEIILTVNSPIKCTGIILPTGDNPSHVWIYLGKNSVACVDLRSVVGVATVTE